MADMTDYTKYLPKQPPEGLIEWVRRNGKLGGEYLIYKQDYYWDPYEDRRVKAVLCKCTACGDQFYMKLVRKICSRASYSGVDFGFWNPREAVDVISGNNTLCPHCGEDVSVRHVSSMGTRGHGTMIGHCYPLTVHNLNGNLALLCWFVSRRIDRSGQENIFALPNDGYLFTVDKNIRFSGLGSGLFYTYHTGVWKQLKVFKDVSGTIPNDVVYPWDPSLLEGTCAENSKLDVYMESAKESYPVAYLRTWRRFPNTENLVMQGFTTLINYRLSKLKNNDGSPNINKFPKGLNLKEAKPHKILGISKEEMKRLQRKKWDVGMIDMYLRTKDRGITMEELPKLMKEHAGYEIKQIAEHPVNLPKALRYLSKQQKKEQEDKRKKYYTITAQYLCDYWTMAKANGYDMTEDSVLYPHKLIRAHDTAQREIELKASKEREKDFENRYRELKKFNYSSGGLSIHPAKDELEMITEGQKLHHCVGTYAKKHASGRTSIFFLRHESEPDEPYFTLELDVQTLTVLQNRGLENRARTEDVERFEQEWLKFVKSIIALGRKI